MLNYLIGTLKSRRSIKKVKRLARSIGDGTIFGGSFAIRFSDKGAESAELSLGEECYIDCAFHFEKEGAKVTIGKNCFIGAKTKLIAAKSIQIGDQVTISWGVTFVDHNSHSLDRNRREEDHQIGMANIRSEKKWCEGKRWHEVTAAPIIVEDGVWIGFEAVVMKGVTLGKGSVVGARAVVVKDVPAYAVVAGNPAKIVGNCSGDVNY